MVYRVVRNTLVLGTQAFQHQSHYQCDLPSTIVPSFPLAQLNLSLGNTKLYFIVYYNKTVSGSVTKIAQ